VPSTRTGILGLITVPLLAAAGVLAVTGPAQAALPSYTCGRIIRTQNHLNGMGCSAANGAPTSGFHSGTFQFYLGANFLGECMEVNADLPAGVNGSLCPS
jgi:hypothetical protein